MRDTKPKEPRAPDVEAAVRRYLAAIDRALPHLERIVQERQALERFSEQEGRADD